MSPTPDQVWEQYRVHVMAELERISKHQEKLTEEFGKLHDKLNTNTASILDKLSSNVAEIKQDHKHTDTELKRIDVELAAWKGRLWGFGTAAGLAGTAIGYLVQAAFKKLFGN